MTPTHDRPTGRVLHAGPAVVDVSARVQALPAPGGNVGASDPLVTVGGGFNVMAAAARAGARVSYLGLRGDGPFSRLVDEALAREGVALPSATVPGVDAGWCVALVDPSGERSLVTAMNAEVLDNSSALASVAVAGEDVVYVTGYSFLGGGSGGALLRWLPCLPAGTRLLVDVSPLVADVPDEALELLRVRASVWSANRREAEVLHARLVPGSEVPGDVLALASSLAATVQGVVVVRDGADGCWWTARDAEPVHVPGLQVEAVDTTGAGDTHAGVLMAHLAEGMSFPDSIVRATVAASASVGHRGPATAPTRGEVDALLAGEAPRGAVGGLG